MIQVYLSSIFSNEDTDEWGEDNLYAIVVAVNLAPNGAGLPGAIPQFQVRLYTFPETADQGDMLTTLDARQSFWGINGQPAALDNPDNAIFLFFVMENDGGNWDVMRGLVQTAVSLALGQTLGWQQQDIVQRLIQDIQSVRPLPTAITPDQDDEVGPVQELRFTHEELVQAELGQGVVKQFTFDGDDGRFTLTFCASNIRVGANPQDKWVLSTENRILVITNTGDVFAHDFKPNLTLSLPYQLDAHHVAANPQDRWIMVMGNRILVITRPDGAVWAHDINGNTISAPYQLTSSSRVAANPQDKWVIAMGNRILVITYPDGHVWAHDINGNMVGNPYQLTTHSRVAASEHDRRVLALGNKILIITNSGAAVTRDVNGNEVSEHTVLIGPAVAPNPGDKYVRLMGTRLIVIRDDGKVFTHEISGNTIGVPYQI